MKDFAFAWAAQPADVPAALGVPGTAILAGGTELLNWMRLGISAPGVIDVGRLDGLTRIERDDDRLSIGARATLNQLGESDLVVEHARALSQACLRAASAQVRNRATLGGNVLQKTRCPYFRAEAPLPWPCNKRAPGSGCAARHGANDRHAIFGWTDACVAVQPSDPAVALACLDAEAEVIGPAGRRFIPMRSFHVTQEDAAAAGRDAATFETNLAHDELIVAYHIPIRRRSRSAYLKVRERESYEYALVSAAADVVLDGSRIDSARIALGSVAQRPWRLDRAEVALAGRPLTREAIAPVIEAATQDARPLAHNRYKLAMARAAAVRALLMAGGQA